MKTVRITITFVMAMLLVSSGSLWRRLVVGLAANASPTNPTGGSESHAPPVSLPDQSIIEYFFPKSIRFATGENCQAPAQKDEKKGVALYYTGLHPRNPQRVMVTYALAFAQDCGLAGHKGAHGAEPHPGDLEYFHYTLKEDSSCTKGWRLHALKTVAHSGDYKRREINERIMDSCNPPDQIVSSLGKHALYISWLDCSKRTPAEVCLDGFGADYNLYNIGTTPSDNPDLSLLMGGAAGGPDKVWPSKGDGKFCGGQNISNRDKDCVGAPGDKMSKPADLKEWELPDPDLGGDHKCPYGLDYSGGLCYQKCKSGYRGEATMCVPECPSGFRDDGLYCAKPKSYGRGAGYAWKFGDPANSSKQFKRCENDHGKGKCQKSGAIVYPKCKANFHAVGCCTCSPDCPSGMTDIGVSCQKKTYDRGVGSLP